MKYYYEKPENWVGAGEVYCCNHPFYDKCTLFRKGDFGFAVIQERFSKIKKTRLYGPIEPWIAGDIYLNERFDECFDKYAGKVDGNGLYPTIPLRKIMWELRMKPLRKELWEEFG